MLFSPGEDLKDASVLSEKLGGWYLLRGATQTPRTHGQETTAALGPWVLSRFIHVIACQYVIALCDWIIFLCMYIPQFVFAFIPSWTFGLSPPFDTENSTAMSLCLHVFVKFLFCILLGIYLEVDSMDHMVILFSTIGGIAKLFSIMAELFCFPISNVWRFQFLHFLANTISF